MASTIDFGGTAKESMTLINSTGMFLIAECLRPYFMALGQGVMERVYFKEDVCWRYGIDFSSLTVEEYMECYHIMCYVFERHLPSVFGDFMGKDNKEGIIKIWQEELKPGMVSAPLFLSGFHINEGNFVHVKDKELLTFFKNEDIEG